MVGDSHFHSVGGFAVRELHRIVLTLGLVALLAVPALAQQQQQRRGGGAQNFATLLQNDSVQKELKIDKDQADKVKEAAQKVMTAHQDDQAKLRDIQDMAERQR